MVVQAVVLLAAFLAMRKAAQLLDEKIDAMRASVHPLLESSSNLLVKLAPRIDAATDDISAIARSVRAQSAEIQVATTEIVARARSQAGRLDSMLSTQAVRVDSMLSSALDTVDRAGMMLADAVNKPVRQFSALLASVKAVIESLRATAPPSRSRGNHTPADRDMFV
jgi:hypothetical protein